MERDRWEQIERLYHAALEREPDARDAFLDEACAGDEALRREVAGLLSCDIPSDSFIQSPAIEIAARAWAAEPLIDSSNKRMGSPIAGSQIGAYQLLSPLGRGGMGEVHLALDTRLGRKVAVKLLPAAFTTDADRVQRFAREARAASALNHPNIITIHEIGETATENGSLRYIVTEYVEGETLRQRMASAPQQRMEQSEAIEVAAQIAAALAAAHEAGITHRDIKPENVMVRGDGIVKVLDFGLAKLTEPSPPVVETQAPTVAGGSTEAGIVIGTPRYMSPEQARGEKVDTRTDIFSLGVLMYEMIAGRAPFAGTTPGEMIAAILRDSPPPLAECASGASRELERVIDKTLVKDRGERYQSARDLLTDLKELKRRIEFGTRPGETAFAAAARTLWPRLRSSRIILAASTAAVVLIVALSYFHLTGERKQSSASMPRSIAVLPFKPLVANNRDEALELGMADTLITKLSNLNQIIVRPTSAVRKYAALDQDPLAAGREQQVETVLEGSMYLSGDKIRVTVRLLNVRDGTALATYQCTEYCTDIFAAQDLISEKIARALASNLTGEERRRLAKRYTENIAAYELYLEGRYFWEKRTEEDLKRAIGYFKQAISVDPNYALAYAGIAHCYGPLAFNGHLAPDLAAPQMKAAAMKAIELDDTLAEAHTALAAYLAFHEWDWEEGERTFKRAIELNPNYPTAHMWYALHLENMGRLEEAMAAEKRALEIDPLHIAGKSRLAYTLCLAGKCDQAIEIYHKTLELTPNFYLARLYLGIIYERKRMFEEAIAEFRLAVKMSGNTVLTKAALAHAYAISGKRDEAQRSLNELVELSKRQYVSPTQIAIVYAGLGDQDRTFIWLEQACERRDPVLSSIKFEHRLDSLRADRRYPDLLRRMRLAP